MKVVYFFTTILLFSAFLLTDPIQAAAPQTHVVKVGDAALQVRSGPSTEAEVIGQLRDGQRVNVFDVKNGWAQIYLNRKMAWIAGHYLLPAAENKAATVTVTEDNARVRTGPGTKYPITYIANRNDTYELLTTANNWHKIELSGGESGWMASWLTDKPTIKPKQKSTQEPKKKLKDKPKTKNTTIDKSLKDYTIVLDAGHGGKDPGAIATDNTYEKNLTLTTVEKVAEHLRNSGANVILTRDDDSYLSLDERTAISGEIKPDAFISIHFNAFPDSSVNGISTFYYQNGNTRRFAENLQQGIAGHTKLKDRGTRHGSYRVLRKNSNLAALIELGFMTNPGDLSVIKTEAYQNNVAKGITTGVKEYFAVN